MAIEAHLIEVDPNDEVLSGTLSDDQIYDVLTSSRAVELGSSWKLAFPLAGSIAGTSDVLSEDTIDIGEGLGLGPARFIDLEQVAMIRARLASADPATIKDHWARIDTPFSSADSKADDELKQQAMNGYRTIVELFASAAAGSHGVLFAIM